VKLRRRILNFDCIILYFNNLDRIERKNEKKEKEGKKKFVRGANLSAFHRNLPIDSLPQKRRAQF